MRTLKMKAGSTPLSLYKECEKLFPVWIWDEKELENVKSERTCEEDYEIIFKNNVEADEDLKNLSANDLKEKGIKGITLEERLQYELDYFKETGKHLDIDNITLCAGSRYTSGRVPRVYCRGDEVLVDWAFRGDAYDFLRSRAVSKPQNYVTLNLSEIEIDGVSYKLTRIK